MTDDHGERLIQYGLSMALTEAAVDAMLSDGLHIGQAVTDVLLRDLIRRGVLRAWMDVSEYDGLPVVRVDVVEGE